MSSTLWMASLILAGATTGAEPTKKTTAPPDDPRAQAVIDEVEKICLDDRVCMIGRKRAERLAELVRKAKPRLVVECGTALGYSGLWIARELKAAGKGRLVTIEIDPKRAKQAQANFRKAGLQKCVTVKLGDARKLFKQIKGPIDFVFIDCGYSNYYPCLKGLQKELSGGATIVADNVGIGARGMEDYLKEVRSRYKSHTEWFEVNLPWGKRDAMEISVVPGRRDAGPNKKPEKPAAGRRLETGTWGKEKLGLQCRTKAPTEIEQGMSFQVHVDIRSHPRHLQPGVKRLNLFLHDAFLELSLSNPRTGKTYAVKPYDPTAGMPVRDSGKDAVPLDGTTLEPLRTGFPLAKVYDALPPGRYECRVAYSLPGKRTPWWHGADEEWKAAGFWHGTVVSGPFRLNVLKEPPSTRTLMLPKRLRLENARICFKKEDAEKVEVSLRNGHFVGAYYYRGGDKNWYALGGPPKPNDVISIDNDVEDEKKSYTIEVFETADRPCHMWRPGPGSGGYKVLWKKTLAVF